MKKRSITLFAVGGVLLTITVIFLLANVCKTGWFSAAMYRYTGSGKWLHSALYHGVHNGQTIEQVERLLGPGTEPEDSKVYNVSRKFAAMNPAGWPDGCKENDKFLEFSLSGGALYLQFRNGILINFNPEDFKNCEETIAVSAD